MTVGASLRLWQTGPEYLLQYWTPPASAEVPATYDTAALVAAIAAAAAGSGYVRLDQDITLSSDVTLTAGVTIFSLVGARVTGRFIVEGSQGVYGLKFTRGVGQHAIRFRASSAVNNLTVACNEFTGGTVIIDLSTADNSMHTNGVIEHNRFINHNYAVYLQRVARFKFRNNYLINGGTNVQFIGGRANVVSNNIIDGGVTGISFLADISTGDAGQTIEGNIVKNNTVLNFSNEGIGFDANADGPTQYPAIDQFTVIATNGTAASSPAIDVPRTGLFVAASVTRARMRIIFLTGALAGRVFPLSSQSTIDVSSIRLVMPNYAITAAELASITNTDIVQIGFPMRKNVIANNFVKMDFNAAYQYPTGITLYGICYENKVIGNVSFGSPFKTTHSAAIRVVNINGVNPSTSTINNGTRHISTDSMLLACAFNTIANNTCPVGKIVVSNTPYESYASGNLIEHTYINYISNNLVADTCSALNWRDDQSVFSGTPTSDAASITTNTTAYTAGTIDNNSYIPGASSSVVGAGTNLGHNRGADGRPLDIPTTIGAFRPKLNRGIR